MIVNGSGYLFYIPDDRNKHFDILYSVSFIEHDSSHTADDCYQYDVPYKYSMLK
ncbi:hypothetical protein [Parabacteroides timonensis]|uniref:hypothetical protein n=1 Tax=Parabacteroides timonensis TaxID=1871013 RepID=UPI001B305952|nr:hypothetical protein [Parabacteroides timonensis]